MECMYPERQSYELSSTAPFDGCGSVDRLAGWNPGLEVFSNLPELISGTAHSLPTSLSQFNMSYRVGVNCPASVPTPVALKK